VSESRQTLFPPRRVVTGLDADGRPTVVSDDVVTNVTRRRPGHSSYVLWATDEVPVRDDGCPSDERDLTHEVTSRSISNGTVFRIAEYAPGVASALHQTDSVDYAVVLSGEIELVLDGRAVRLRAGDTVVQRGTAHDWRNPGEVPCVIAFCLVGAVPHPAAGSVDDA
jgi:quercetin dioxygenase-like cupin family protein